MEWLTQRVRVCVRVSSKNIPSKIDFLESINRVLSRVSCFRPKCPVSGSLSFRKRRKSLVFRSDKDFERISFSFAIESFSYLSVASFFGRERGGGKLIF